MIARCSWCGDLFDTHDGGTAIDYDDVRCPECETREELDDVRVAKAIMESRRASHVTIKGRRL